LTLVFVVQHPKVLDHVAKHTKIIGQAIADIDLRVYVVLDDKDHPISKGDWHFRQKLVESGLVSPEDAAMTFPVQLEAGMPDRSDP
jgi:hypothetical protein